MKATGIVRLIDELGRIVIPKEMRKTFNISNGDPVEIYVENNRIILEKYHNSCIFCGGSIDLCDFRERKVCKNCIESLKSE